MNTKVLCVYTVLILASCVTFFGLFPSAYGLPAACPAAMGALNIRTVHDSRLLPAQVAAVENVIHETNMFLAEHFILPEKVELRIGYEESYAARNQLRIVVPFIYDNSPEGKGVAEDTSFRLPETAMHSKAITIHEYAHEIYYLNITSLIRNYFKIYEVAKVYATEETSKAQQRYEDLAEQVYFRIEEINAELIGWRATRDSEGRAEVSALLDEKDKLLEALTREKQLLDAEPKIIPFDLPYNELFADLVTVAETDDPQVIQRVIMYKGMSESQKRAATLRDFSYMEDLTSWNEKEAHVSLSPVRFYLWQYFLSRPEYRTPAQRSTVVKKVFKAIVAELKDRIQTRSYELPPKIMNRRLIARIREEMAL